MSVLKVDLLERNEAYVKFLERVAVVFNACGTVVATVKGALALKSFLAGTPSVTVGLSSEVVLRDELTDGQPLHPPGANVLEGFPSTFARILLCLHECHRSRCAFLSVRSRCCATAA